jgi:hypothetical protein
VTPRTIERWGVLWRSRNRLDGDRCHLISFDGIPVMFKTRREARAYAEHRHGYIKRRPDLQAEPHGWRMPVPVRVTVAVQGSQA